MTKVLVLTQKVFGYGEIAKTYLLNYAKEPLDVYNASLQGLHLPAYIKTVLQLDNLDTENTAVPDVVHFAGKQFDFVITICNCDHLPMPADIKASQIFHINMPDLTLSDSDATLSIHEIDHIREVLKHKVLKVLGKIVTAPNEQSST